MKKFFLILGTIVCSIASYAQTNYTVSYATNVGNPGALNNDDDATVSGWNTIIGASILTNQWSVVVPIPFSFNYFGNPVSEFKASANGLVTFSTTTAILPNDNQSLPSATLPDSTIACFWDGFTTLPPTASNDVVVWKIWGTAPNRQLWIKWVSYEIGAPRVDNAHFMCVLEESTDKIYLVEGAFTTGPTTLASTTTAGIQLNNTNAMMYGSPYRPRIANTTLTTDNNVLTFTPFVKSNMTFNQVTATQPNTQNIAKNTVNEVILRVVVNMQGELSPVNLTQIAFGTSGTTLDADITNARVFFTGNDSNYSPINQLGTTISSPSGTFTVTGNQQLKMGNNYFWLAYTLSNSAAVSNSIDATCNAVTVNGVVQTLIDPAPLGNRSVHAALSGVVNVGSGNAYVYLSDVFKEINTNGLSGNLTLAITSDIDDTAVANLTYTSGSNYWIKIVPSADVVRNITSRFTSTFIEFSGSKYVTIDGKGPVSGTGKYLRFLNKDIFGSTFTFSNGARFDTIRNCTIEGAIDSQIKGMIHLGTSASSSTGVRDIQILNNDIRDRSDSIGIPAIMIFSAGTTVLPNSNITLNNNHIFNYRRSAVYINSGDVNGGDFTISNNHMYYNAPPSTASGDVVSIMLIPGYMSENNVISGNYIGGQAPFCGGAAWQSTNSVNWTAMNINAGFTAGASIQNNTIQNVYVNLLTTIVNLSFVGIRMESGAINVGTTTGNLIGHPSTPNSILNNSALTYPIFSLYGTGFFTIANNTIANIVGANTSGASSTRAICVQAGGAIPTIYNNTIYNIRADGTTANAITNILQGIGVVSGPEVSPTIIRNNTIYNLTVTNTSAATVPTAIIIDQATANGIVEGNKIYGIENPSTNVSAFIHGIYIVGNAKNWIVKNNMISLTNGTNTNAMIIRGISDNASGNIVSYMNNTIYIGGTTGGATNSFAFERRNPLGISTLRNNILYNERTGGSGIHAAIGNVPGTTANPASNNWTITTSGYNLLVSAIPNTIGAWGNPIIASSFSQWQNTSGGDLTSWSDTSVNIPSAAFFKSIATGDLTIDSSNALCWYANGKGIAITGNTADMHGQTRSNTIATGGVDIGADEFPTATLPPFATVTGNLLLTDSSVFTFAGRTIAKVYWTAGFIPTAVSLRYYSGTTPPSILPGKNYFNSYYHFVATGAGSYTSNIKLFYDSALFGTVPNAASIILARFFTSANHWFDYPSITVNTSEQSFIQYVNIVNGIFTGTDVANPLPTELVKFAAQSENQQDVSVYWSTASEKNADRFEVEVSVDEKAFEVSGTVKANGNTNTINKYAFLDAKAFDNNNADKLYYRLKMIDMDGGYTYSKTVSVSRNDKTEPTVELYPNPFTPATQLVITSVGEQKGSVTISDVRGTIVSTQSLSLQAGTNIIASGELLILPSGLYFIKVSVGDENYNLKLVK